MKVSYAKQTVDSPNPVARYAHRSRLKKSIELARKKIGNGRALDFGCGSGFFVSEFEGLFPGRVFGFEPYMVERVKNSLPILSSLEDTKPLWPLSLITIFETIEHLSELETLDFLTFCKSALEPEGGVLMSGPIMVGPALFMKEANRAILFRQRPEHSPLELVKAGLLGLSAPRTTNIKGSHKGYDFRQSIREFEKLGWKVDVINFGPLPIGTWYGNSQFYCWLTRSTDSK